MRSATHAERWAPGQITWPPARAFLPIDQGSAVGEGWARCTGVALCDDDGRPCGFFRAGQRAHWYYEFEALTDLYEVSGVLTLLSDKNIRVHGKNTIHLGVRPDHPLQRGDTVRIHQSVKLDLTPGAYTFGVGLSATEPGRRNGAGQRGFLASDIVQAGTFQIIPPVGAHLGLCDLPGECEVELCSSISPLIPDPAIPG
jgi:lipopolysaccharide transport system ATP-binding protein